MPSRKWPTKRGGNSAGERLSILRKGMAALDRPIGGALVANGQGEGIANSRGMVIGALAFSLSCLVGIVAVCRYRALPGSSLLILTWLVAALPGYALFLR